MQRIQKDVFCRFFNLVDNINFTNLHVDWLGITVRRVPPFERKLVEPHAAQCQFTHRGRPDT
jgi:hypothetical protein